MDRVRDRVRLRGLAIVAPIAIADLTLCLTMKAMQKVE